MIGPPASVVTRGPSGRGEGAYHPRIMNETDFHLAVDGVLARTVAETAQVSGDLGRRTALVDPHLGDPLVIGHAGAEHRDPPRRKVLDRGMVAGAAEREDDGVEGEPGEPRHRGLG